MPARPRSVTRRADPRKPLDKNTLRQLTHGDGGWMAGETLPHHELQALWLTHHQQVLAKRPDAWALFEFGPVEDA